MSSGSRSSEFGRRGARQDLKGLAIGLDVGGTKTAAMRVDAEGRILARRTVPTPADDSEKTLAAMIEAARSVLDAGVTAVGVGAAGMVDFATGVLRYAPNLAWREMPIASRVSEALGLPCRVDNDANVAAWGEFLFGAGREYRDMLLVTVGTGIGGGIVAGGKMFRGGHGFAAEIGHIIVEPGGPICGCGNRGCWEQVASGRAIERLGRGAVTEHPRSLLSRMANGDPAKLEGPMVTQAAEQGDDVARGILAGVGERLGQGIAGLVNVLDSEVVVVGGGAIAAHELLIGPAREAFDAAIGAPQHRPEVSLAGAQLGNDAGAMGAATMALQEFED